MALFDVVEVLLDKKCIVCNRGYLGLERYVMKDMMHDYCRRCLECGKDCKVQIDGYHSKCKTCKKCGIKGDSPIHGLIIKDHHIGCSPCLNCGIDSGEKIIYCLHISCCEILLSSPCKLCNLPGTVDNPVKGGFHASCRICKICGLKDDMVSIMYGFHHSCASKWAVK